MAKKINSYIFEHFSLVIIILGAISLFSINLFLKENMRQAEYGRYSIFITFFSTIYIYGLLGFEQVFLRHSQVIEKNSIVTQKIQIKIILFILLVTTIISSICFLYFYKDIQTNPFFLVLAIFSMTALTILFSVFRLNENYVLSQIISNGFKIILFIYILILYYLNMLSLNSIIKGTMLIIIGFFVYALAEYKRKIEIVYNLDNSDKEIAASFFYFFISITSFSILIFSDRFIIQDKFGYEITGDYYYLSNIFLAPFSIIQSYISFKLLIHYKKNFTIKNFTSNNKKIVLLASLICLMLFLTLLLVDYFKLLKFNFKDYKYVIILLLLSGIVRLYSLSISAAFDAISSHKNLKKANLIIIFFTLLIVTISILFFKTITQILWSIILIWLLRAYVLKRIIINQ